MHVFAYFFSDYVFVNIINLTHICLILYFLLRIRSTFLYTKTLKQPVIFILPRRIFNSLMFASKCKKYINCQIWRKPKYSPCTSITFDFSQKWYTNNFLNQLLIFTRHCSWNNFDEPENFTYRVLMDLVYWYCKVRTVCFVVWRLRCVICFSNGRDCYAANLKTLIFIFT